MMKNFEFIIIKNCSVLFCYSMLVEISAERDRYLALSTSSAAAAARSEVELEKASNLEKMVRELQGKVASNGEVVKAMEAEKIQMQSSYEARLSESVAATETLKIALAEAQQDGKALTSQVSEREMKLKSIVAELEAERTRCQELQSGMGQKSNE
jgi:translation initiation factor 1 (eIF-1/SUI1)